MYDRALAGTRLSATQLDVLLTLAQVGPSNLKTLAHHLGADASTMARVVARLARSKLVHIATGSDRRHRVVGLTGAGARRVTTTLPVWDAIQDRFIRRIGPRAWTRMLHNLDRVFQATHNHR